MSLEGKKLGFIGTGKMGSALIKGICNAGLFSPSGVYASDLYEPSLDELKQNAGVNVSTDNAATVINSDIIVLAVKPQILKKVIAGIKEDIGSDKLVISIAAGVKLADIEREFNEGTRVIRVMPNIAATVAEAASAITQGSNASKEDAEDALAIFGSVGSAIQVPENLMDAVTGLSAVDLHIYSLLLKQWQMVLYMRDLTGRVHLYLQLRRFWALQKWHLKLKPILAN